MTARNGLIAEGLDIACVVGYDNHARGAFNASPARYGIGEWYGATGMMVTTSYFALKIQRYLHEHGISERTLGYASEKAFDYATAHPYAWRRKPVSVDEAMDADMINDPADPLHVLLAGRRCGVARPGPRLAGLRPVRDPDPAGVGGAARSTSRLVRGVLAVAGAGRAHEPVHRCGGRRVRGSRHHARRRPGGAAAGHRQRRRGHPPRRDRTGRRTGTRRSAYRNGDFAIDGRLPVNTDGGLLANGEPVGASGLRQVHEVVRQLQGRADGKQVPGSPAHRIHPRLRSTGHQRLHGPHERRSDPVSELDHEHLRRLARRGPHLAGLESPRRVPRRSSSGARAIRACRSSWR